MSIAAHFFHFSQMYVIQLERHYLICEHANEALMGMCGVGKRSVVPIVVGLTTDRGDPGAKEYVCGIWN